MTYWMGAGNANVWCILRDFCRINRALFGLVSYNDPWNSGILYGVVSNISNTFTRILGEMMPFE